MKRLLPLCLLLAAAIPAAAHDFWIVPSSFRPAPGSALAVRLKVGERLQGDVVPRDPWQVARFVLRSAAGEKKVDGPPGAEPAGFVRLAPEDRGLAWLVYQSRGTRLDLPAAEFEKALKLEGLERIVELRRQNGDSAKPSKEVFSRSAKALLKLGDGSGTLWSQPVGLPLELVPEKNPLSPDRELPVRLLYQGKPLAGALVVALHAQHLGGDIAARSGADGRVRLKLSATGFWLIKAVHMVPASPANAGADWESHWASLTFERVGP